MTSKIIWSVAGVVLVLLAGYIYQTVPSQSEIKIVSMINNDGQVIGTVRLSETKAGVLFDLNVKGLTPNGEHAIHVHERGDCTPIENFKNAGGHFNPTSKKHGMKHPQGQHAGDMPNLKPNKDGEIKIAFVNLSVTFKNGETSIYDADGSAIMIHAGADDHMSQPSGAAGSRIACGVIE